MQRKKTLVGLCTSSLLVLSFGAQPGAEAAPPTAPTAAASAPAVPKAGAPASKRAAPAAVAGPDTAPPAAASAAPSPAAPAGGQPTHMVRLRDLEEQIDELKEKLRRQYAQLALLNDRLADSGAGGEARASIKFASDLSGAFQVSRVLVVLDGAVQVNQTYPSGTLAERFEVPVFHGLLPAGDHTVQVLVNLQGNGYGIFSYMRGYRFEVRSTHSFTAVEGKTINLEAIAFEKGTSTTPFEERPALRYGEKIVAGLADAAVRPAPGTK
jgi:hypothetical protein